MRVAIYGRRYDRKYIPQIQKMIAKINDVSESVFVYQKFLDFVREDMPVDFNVTPFSRHEDIAGKVDFLFSIGGDGTLLDTLSIVRDSGIPVLGFNTGRLGFLSGISMDATEDAINALANKQFSLDKRALLRLHNPGVFGAANYALNEMSIHKRDSATMMIVHAFVNDVYLNSYWADGLIVSTPTGSTAYSLSCGGPIMLPDSENFIITPIAPHNLNVRPIVISDRSVIRLKLEGRSKNYIVALDSRSEAITDENDLVISKETFKFNLVRLHGQDFLDTLRNKLMWGMDLRN